MSFRVLVADDDDLTRTLIILAPGSGRHQGYGGRRRRPGGHELTLQRPFDLLMLDWHMPGKSGLEVVKAIRGRGSQVPIVMVSAEAARDQIVEAMRAGASDYILKPFDAKTLLVEVEKYRNAGSTSAAAKDTARPRRHPRPVARGSADGQSWDSARLLVLGLLAGDAAGR